MFQKPVIFLDVMEMWNSIHFHDIPIKGTLLTSISTIHSEAKSPFPPPTRGL